MNRFERTIVPKWRNGTSKFPLFPKVSDVDIAQTMRDIELEVNEIMDFIEECVFKTMELTNEQN